MAVAAWKSMSVRSQQVSMRSFINYKSFLILQITFIFSHVSRVSLSTTSHVAAKIRPPMNTVSKYFIIFNILDV